MKIKTIIILLIIVLITFLIYIYNKDDKIYLLNLGNNNEIYQIEEYLKNENKLEQTINISSNLNQIIDNIKTNKKIQNRTMKNHLIKADFIIITTESKKDNLNELIKIVKQYSKEEIIIIGQPTSENILVSRNNKVPLFTKNKTTDSIINYIKENIQ